MCLLFGYDLILWLFVCDLVFIYWFRLRWFFYCYMSLGGVFVCWLVVWLLVCWFLDFGLWWAFCYFVCVY